LNDITAIILCCLWCISICWCYTLVALFALQLHGHFINWSSLFFDNSC